MLELQEPAAMLNEFYMNTRNWDSGLPSCMEVLFTHWTIPLVPIVTVNKESDYSRAVSSVSPSFAQEHPNSSFKDLTQGKLWDHHDELVG